jgi:hypothetical protein
MDRRIRRRAGLLRLKRFCVKGNGAEKTVELTNADGSNSKLSFNLGPVSAVIGYYHMNRIPIFTENFWNRHRHAGSAAHLKSRPKRV